jgi:hypothetical protein
VREFFSLAPLLGYVEPFELCLPDCGRLARRGRIRGNCTLVCRGRQSAAGARSGLAVPARRDDPGERRSVSGRA